jgi:hypothetical protein
MADVGSEREGVAEPRDIIQVIISSVHFFFLFLVVVLILTHDFSHIHA